MTRASFVLAAAAVLSVTVVGDVIQAQTKPPDIIAVCHRRGACMVCTDYKFRGGELGQYSTPAGCALGPLGVAGYDDYELSLATHGGDGWTSGGAVGITAGFSMAGLIFSHIFGDGGYANLNRGPVAQLDQLKNDIAERTTTIRDAFNVDSATLAIMKREVLRALSRGRQTLLTAASRGVSVAAHAGAIAGAEPLVAAEPIERGQLVADFLTPADPALGQSTTIAPATLRVSGRSLLNFLENARRSEFKSRLSLANEVEREVRKHKSHQWQSVDAERLAAGSLAYAEGFSLSPSPSAQRLATGLLESARSGRYWDSRSLDDIVVPVVDERGHISLSRVGRPAEIPTTTVVGRLESIRAERAGTEAAIRGVELGVRNLPVQSSARQRSEFSIEAALRMLGAGNSSYAAGDLARAEEQYRFAVALVDTGLSAVPGLGAAKTLIEAAVGFNLTTGESIDDGERLERFVEAIALSGTVGSVRDRLEMVGTAIGNSASARWMVNAVETFFQHVEEVNPYLAVERVKSTAALIRTHHGLVTSGRISAEQYSGLEQRIISIGRIGPPPGFYPVPVIGEKQLPHLPGSLQPGKSVWTGGDAQQAVIDKMGTGTFVGQPHLEMVRFERPVGRVIGETGEDLGETNWAIIHYSRTEAHIVPERPPLP